MTAAVEQNGTKKPLTAKQAQAAALLAADELSDHEIAEKVGVGRTTLARWKDLPEFQELTAEHVAAVQAAMLRLDIAKRHKRLAVLNDLHQKALTVVEERAVAYESDIAGGGTGLIAKDVKGVGTGQNATLVDVYAVDTGLMREIRALQEQAAKELGQWIEKGELAGMVTSKIELVGVDAESI